MNPFPVTEIADYLRRDITWDRFAKIVCATGVQLNDSQFRFLKGRVMEEGLAICSNNTLKYVGHTEDGCDFIMWRMEDTRIEMKFDAEGIFTPKDKLRKTITVKLMNSHGSNTRKGLPVNYADFLIVASTRGVVLIPKSTFKHYLKLSLIHI